MEEALLWYERALVAGVSFSQILTVFVIPVVLAFVTAVLTIWVSRRQTRDGITAAMESGRHSVGDDRLRLILEDAYWAFQESTDDVVQYLNKDTASQSERAERLSNASKNLSLFGTDPVKEFLIEHLEGKSSDLGPLLGELGKQVRELHGLPKSEVPYFFAVHKHNREVGA